MYHVTKIAIYVLDYKGAVHILGEICPRSNPDIVHMGYFLVPIKFTICALVHHKVVPLH